MKKNRTDRAHKIIAIATVGACIVAFLLSGCAAANTKIQNDAAEKTSADNYTLISESDFDSTLDDENSVFYEYDDAGRTTREIKRSGESCSITTYAYDEDGTKTYETYEDYDYDGALSDKRETEYGEEGYSTNRLWHYSKGELEWFKQSQWVDDDDGNEVYTSYQGTDEDDLAETSWKIRENTTDEDGVEHWVEKDGDGTIVSAGFSKENDAGKTVLYEMTLPERAYQHKETEYDGDGNIVREVGEQTVPGGDEPEQYEYLYHYDSSKKLTYKEDISDGATGYVGDGDYYAYDKQGNMNQVVRVEEGVLSELDSYIYDEHGNLLTSWNYYYDEEGIFSRSVGSTYEYVSNDGQERISGREYDARKFLSSPYADDHSYGDKFLINLEDVYAQYGSRADSCEFMFDLDSFSDDSWKPLEYDSSIHHVQKTNEPLSVVTDSFAFVLPASWNMEGVEVIYGNSIYGDFDIVYRSEKSKKAYRLLSGSIAEESEYEAGDAGDVGFSRALWFADKNGGRRLDIYATSAYGFWYDAKTGYDRGVDGLSDEEKQQILNLLYDGNLSLDDLKNEEEFNGEVHLDFNQASWASSIKDTVAFPD